MLGIPVLSGRGGTSSANRGAPLRWQSFCHRMLSFCPLNDLPPLLRSFSLIRPFSEKYRGCVRAAYRHVQYRQDADEEADLGAEIIAAFAGAEEVRDR